MNAYPVELTADDNDTVMVTFPDVPESISFGEDEADALARAADALETALEGYVADHRHIPAASASDGRKVVCLSPLATLKIGIYITVRERG